MDRLEERVDENRLEQDRNFESRKAQIRKNLRMQYQDILHIDQNTIPPNMDYKWVRETIFDDPSLSKLSHSKMLGWTPVPAQNHPEMMPEFDTGRKHHMDGFIYRRGLVLCQRPKEIGDVEREMEHEANMVAMKSMPGLEGAPNTPLYVKRNDVGLSGTPTFKD